MVRVARRPQEREAPAFIVEELEGKVTETHYKYEKGKGLIKFDVDVPAGYLVTFFKGHSIRVRNKDTLKSLGFDEAYTIDVDGDEELVED